MCYVPKDGRALVGSRRPHRTIYYFSRTAPKRGESNQHGSSSCKCHNAADIKITGKRSPSLLAPKREARQAREATIILQRRRPQHEKVRVKPSLDRLHVLSPVNMWLVKLFQFLPPEVQTFFGESGLIFLLHSGLRINVSFWSLPIKISCIKVIEKWVMQLVRFSSVPIIDSYYLPKWSFFNTLIDWLILLSLYLAVGPFRSVRSVQRIWILFVHCGRYSAPFLGPSPVCTNDSPTLSSLSFNWSCISPSDIPWLWLLRDDVIVALRREQSSPLL